MNVLKQFQMCRRNVNVVNRSTIFTSSASSQISKNLNQFQLKNSGRHLNNVGQTYLKTNFSSIAPTSSVLTEEGDVHLTKLTKETAHSLVIKLTGEERTTLLNTLQQFESEQLKAEYKGQLAAFRWRSKLGRPSKVGLGDVDPTGSFCPVPEDWLLKKYAETIPNPTTQQLFAGTVGITWLLYLAVHNAVPFIGFGFLDNFLMIICGDYIEFSLGCFMTISTMAAAALGNTFSDILGLGAASYVERLAARIGVQPPPLSPLQLNTPRARTSANLGRGIGVTIGCLLGMLPLLFMNTNKESENKENEPTDKTAAAVA